MANDIDKKNKKLPDWAKWPDILALAEITGKANVTIYSILIGVRSDKKIKDIIAQYRLDKEQIQAAQEQIQVAQEELIVSLKEKYNEAS